MTEKINYTGRRNSFMEIGNPYFWTSTIHKWQHLLKDDEFKMILINSLQWLSNRQLIRVYGYVIMPNHIHLIWEELQMNRKEHPKGSFEKFTAHSFQKKLMKESPEELKNFRMPLFDRDHLFWQRDPLAIAIPNREMVWQKLNYIHTNPLQEHWNLCNDPVDYRFSSARFYETGEDEFEILTHYNNRF